MHQVQYTLMLGVGICVVVEGEELALKDYRFTSKDKEELEELLLDVPKLCVKCRKVRKEMLVLDCLCILCRTCMKLELLAKDKSVISSTFESGRKKEATCTCSVHNWRISPKQLQAVYSPEELERYSIEAMRRQVREGKKLKNRWPNICIECKGVISDLSKDNAEACYRHKLCRTCIE
eukprot:TRINITY_DN14833_c0_g3_i8.p2 TRINITY_DN14833_c0_g3~~TRINITY_DN14833_c0_g3_i8.p2  ORF type:complete len:178 (+),score=46.15 TRINITY_DN14833_c0_g3_i8:578-1111(+)